MTTRQVNTFCACLFVGLFTAIVVACLCTTGRSDDCPPIGLVPLANVHLHDGDTITHCDIVCPFGLTIRDRSIRAAGYDAFEINHVRQTVNVTAVEIERGKQAKAALQELIDSGTLYAADSGEHDPYGRVSAWLWVRMKDGDWIDVSRWMKSHHHCRTKE